MRRSLMITVVAATLVMGVVPGASASTGWTVQPTPTPPHGVDGQLLAVSCPSATSCTAVGGYTGLSGPVTLAEHWDGSTWAVQATPNPPGASFSLLGGVSCPSVTSCTAVGEYTPSGSTDSLPLAEHWDGSTWTIQPMPSPAGGFGISLHAVSCPSVTSCTAVGEYGTSAGPSPTLAEYWDGSTWTVQAMPGLSALLEAVSCTAPGKCTAVGWFERPKGFATLAERSYSGGWRVVSARGSSAIPGQLDGVSCTARNSCTAVGQLGASGALAEHWDGSGWTVQATPRPASVTLNAVSCTSAASCTAAGYSGNSAAAVAERYYRGTWRLQPTASPASGKELAGLSCTLASSCTAVGAYSAPRKPLAERS
jgi:hypothetical protein